MHLFVENFYNTKQLYEVVKDLQFKDNIYGEEILDFNLIPEKLHEVFSELLNQKVKITDKSGIIRKSFPTIHFESFIPESVWTAFVALEKTNFKSYKHKETGISYVTQVKEDLQEFVKNNCFQPDNWNVTADINMSEGDLLLVKPWVWHSLSKNLVKVFYLEAHGDKV